MNRGRAVIPLVVLALVALSALAHASPPDPTWLDGMWDGGDHDDVVLIATWADAASAGAHLEQARPLWLLLGAIDACSPSAPRSSTTGIVRDRAPPPA